MSTLGDVVVLIGGVALLWVGARWFVAAAAKLAHAAGVSTLVVGLTVVAFGTSAPELVVSAGAALDGRANVAAGNVLGSNVFNLALVLGLVAVIRPFRIELTLLRRDVVAMAAATAIGIAVLGNRFVSRPEGVILVALLAIYVGWLWVAATRSEGTAGSPSADRPSSDSHQTADGHQSTPDSPTSRADSERSTPRDHQSTSNSDQSTSGTDQSATESNQSTSETDQSPIETARSPRRRGFDAGRLLAGLLFVVAGGRLLVDGASEIALSLGVSEWVVGVTIVAAGTSLPELVTSIVATRRGNVSIAAGNVVGSNVFNLLGVLGIAAIVRPLALDPAVLPGLGWLALVTAIATVVLATGRRLTRLEGSALVVIGVGYWIWSAIG